VSWAERDGLGRSWSLWAEVGWAGEKGRWAMGRFELVWAILIPFIFYF